jgi:nitrite reductase/ring-hydroxylating ferredoxin subunit
MAEIKFLKRNIFQRLFGICATRVPQNPDCWRYADGKITIDPDKAPELTRPGGAIRLEGTNLPERVVVVHGDDGRYHAFQNKCQHAGRRLDPVPQTETVQCCSIGKATYDYSGKLIHGSAKGDIKVYNVQKDSDKITIILEQEDE